MHHHEHSKTPHHEDPEDKFIKNANNSNVKIIDFHGEEEPIKGEPITVKGNDREKILKNNKNNKIKF